MRPAAATKALVRPADHSPMDRGTITVETLLKILLVLVIVWIALDVIDQALDTILGPFQPVLGLIIVLLIILWLLDEI